MNHDLSIGLSMIVKNEEENLKAHLPEILPHVDAVFITDTGSADNTVKVIKKLCERFNKPLKLSLLNRAKNKDVWLEDASEEDFKQLSPYIDSKLNTLDKYREFLKVNGGIFDFSKARQINLQTINTNWAIWLDADDTAEGLEKLRKLVSQAEREMIDGIYLPYHYKIDKDSGITEVSHTKLRVFKVNNYNWTPKAPIHENLFLLKEGKEVSSEDIVIKHHKTNWEESLARNIKVLKFLEKREGDHPDPRTQYLLSRELSGKDINSEEATKHAKLYLKLSPFGGEPMQACLLLAEQAAQKGDFNEELRHSYRAIMAYPDNPAGYLSVAKSYQNLAEYQRCVDYVKIALSKKQDTTEGLVEPIYENQKLAVTLLSESYFELGEFDKSEAVLKEFEKYSNKKDRELIGENLTIVRGGKGKNAYWESLETIMSLLLEARNYSVIGSLLKALPEILQITDKAHQIKRILGMRKIWNKRSIVIITGGLEAWDEKSVFEKGAGGSETAVVEMAMRWGKMGYEVTVYGMVEDKRTYGNVTYLPFDEINLADEYNYFISWRNPGILKQFKIKAKRKYIWLHDVPDPKIMQAIQGSVDKIIVLSNFHRSLMPSIPDSKFYITGNGINVEMIEEVEKENIERIPDRVIYCSSPDRGLEKALDIFEEAKKKRPSLSMVFAYGWNNFDKIRTDAESQEWKNKLVKKMERLGVKDLGRLNKKDLLREMFKADIWLYPTEFQEINCIVAQEIQACGVIPVTSNFAALKEVIRGNYTKIEDAYDVDRDGSIARWAKEKFSWQTRAEEWANNLFEGVEQEKPNPLVSVICVTIRPGIWRVLKETLLKQGYKNIELIVIDGLYEKRKDEVKEYMKDFPYPYLHLPDPDRDRKKYPYGLFHADNAGLYAARGELLVFLQDFIEIPVDGIQKFVDLYELFPNDIYTGVDTRNGYKAKEVDVSDKIDVFKGGKYEIGEVQFKSPRNYNGGLRVSNDPFEWELNYCAAPRKRLLEIGGWDEDWDRAFAFDNTQMGLRIVYMGNLIWVDESNVATCLSHWDMSEGDKFGVPHRTKKTNDDRYVTYSAYLNQEPRRVDKTLDPHYSEEILNIIKKYKNEN